VLFRSIDTSAGRYLAFVDDDVFVEPDWLMRLEEVFRREPEAGLVGGVDVMTESEGTFDLAFDAVLHSFLSNGRSRMGDGVRAGHYYPRLWNMAIPRRVATEAAIRMADGSTEIFNATLSVHEDVDLGERVRRLGREIVFAPDVKVLHRRKTTFTAMVRRDFDIARTCRMTGLQPWGHYALSGALVGVVGLGLGSIFWTPSQMALAVLAAAYAAILLVVGIMAAVRKRRFGVLLLAPIITASLHLARATGYLVGRKQAK
jgi:hypothetical protein